MIASLIFVFAQLGSAGSAQVPPLLNSQPLTFVYPEEDWREFLASIKTPVLLDVENLPLSAIVDVPLKPIAEEWMGDWARSVRRDIIVFGGGYAVMREAESGGSLAAPNSYRYLFWLGELGAEDLHTLMADRMSVTAGTPGVRDIALSMATNLPGGFAAFRSSPSTFTLGLGMRMEATGLGQTTLARTFTGSSTRVSQSVPRPWSPAPMPTLGQFTPGSPTIEFEEEGELMRTYDLATLLATKTGYFLTYDARIWESRVFVKGTWEAEKLAQALLKMCAAREGQYYNRFELERKKQEIEERLLNAFLSQAGIDGELRDAILQGRTVPASELLDRWPEMRTQIPHDFELSPDAKVNVNLSFEFNLIAPGVIESRGPDGVTDRRLNGSFVKLDLIKPRR